MFFTKLNKQTKNSLMHFKCKTCMQCNFTGGITPYIYIKGHKTASTKNNCWLCDQLDFPCGLHMSPPPAPHTYSISWEPLTIDHSCWCSSSQCLMLVSEQLACLHLSGTQNYVATLSPFSLSLFPLSILRLDIFLFSPQSLTVWHITGGVTAFTLIPFICL